VINIKELQSYNNVEANVDGILLDDKAQKARFRLLGPLGKAYNIVVYICSSPSYIARFRALAGRIIPMDNYTRWNSWFKMLQVLLLLKAYVKEYCVEFKNKLYKDLLDFND